MASSRKNTSHPVQIALMIVFGLLVLIAGYAVLNGGIFEVRSKAALGENIVKRWEFDTSADGWTTTLLSNVKVANGLLVGDFGKPVVRPNPRCSDRGCQNTLYSKKSGLWMITNCNDITDADGDQQLCNSAGRVGWCGGNVFCCPGPQQKWTGNMSACGGSKYPSLVQKTVNTNLSAGKKYAKVRLAVAPGNALTRTTGLQKAAPFTLTLTYEGKTVRAVPLQASGLANGKFSEYTFVFPDIGTMTINALAMRLDGIPVGSKVQLDWVRLVSVIDTTPPTTTPPTPTPQAPTPYASPTPSPATTLTPSAFQNAYYLDGKYNYINIPGSTAIQPSFGFTFEAMFKPTQVPFNGYLVSKSNGSNNGFTIYMLAETDPQNSANTRFWYEMGVADGSLNCAARSMTNEMIVPNADAFAWQHIAGVIESDGTLKLYVNGKASVFNTNKITTPCTTTIPFALGARVLGAGDIQGYLPGILDEVRFTSASRYAANFTPPIAPFTTDTNTGILYHLDDFYGDGFIKDYSGKGLDGVSYGNIKFVPH